MKFFIDTANLEMIQEAQDLGILDGVTTNPSLMAKEGISGSKNIVNHYKKICEIVDGDVSAEVISTDFDGMVKEGEALAKLHSNIVVKVPIIKDGIKAIKYFSDKGIKTNCTLIFSAGQALLAAKAGATYVSPFIGRLDDVSTDGMDLIAQIREIYDNYMFDTEILAASVRHPMHIIQCAEIGADVMTGPLSAITALLNHPLTDIGLAKFLADFKKVNG
ncbi:MAG: fructose-6-phosphate aldolase [Parvicellaceae bacterium]|jgi:transaldolase|nr:fructose-6-phosphate aldolase [Crocinitomicaceae bacterium]MDB2539224.1 fructose-6-phosphate aldolase [Flavobacteriales bacterium]CAI8165488.1 MAG: Transaldolase [Crocinitomicaceae bacterium]|tara:strand:+ start:629 stop:1285 length:657 start_codon:yes stop_codon:yes gene_type:complete